MTELQEYELQLEEAQRKREQAQADLSDAKERLERESRRIRALTQIVKGLRELEPTVQPQSQRLPMAFEPLSKDEIEQLMAPRGQEALRRVMRDSGRDWKPAQLIAEVKDRGWIDPNAKTPEAAVRVALRRLVDAGEVEKNNMTGLYRYQDSGKAPEEAVPAAEGLEAATQEGG
jgi:seryl-tRNA synthetase